MELDSRIVEGKRPLTCFDIEEAKKHIGEECYFTSKFDNFENLSKVTRTTLHNVDDGPVPFQCFDDDGIFCYDCFILPCEWVNEAPKKKYRPLTSEEFLALYDSGKLHSIRQADAKGRYIITDIYFSDSCGKEEVYVCFDCGDCGYEMEYLLENNFEYLDENEWKPFGIEIHK